LLGAVSCRWRRAERRLSVCRAPADVAAGALDAREQGARAASGASAVRSRNGRIIETAASRITDVVTSAAARQRGAWRASTATADARFRLENQSFIGDTVASRGGASRACGIVVGR